MALGLVDSIEEFVGARLHEVKVCCFEIVCTKHHNYESKSVILPFTLLGPYCLTGLGTQFCDPASKTS